MRTITIYREDKQTGEVIKLEAGKGYVNKDNPYDIADNMPFHQKMIKAYSMAEDNGQLRGLSARAKSFVRDVHETATACGGDLPAFGSTRLRF